MFKKIISMIIAASLFLFSGCTAEIYTPSNDGKLSIVATIFPGYDFAKHIAGNAADVKMLLPPGTESHSYEPTPNDMIMVKNCDIFIYVGGDSDAWADQILSAINTKNMKIIKMMDCVNTLDEEVQEGMQLEKGDEEEGERDEHVWTSIRNSEKILGNIAENMENKDKYNSRFYEKNYKKYLLEMKNLDDEYKKITAEAKRKILIFGDRFPILYFTRDYGLDYRAAFVGCSSETECSAGTLGYLIDKVKSENIPVVFYIEFSTHKIADVIAEETGAKKYEFNTCHNITQKQIDSGVSYVELMRQNEDGIKAALN